MVVEKTKFYTLQADPVFKNVFYRDTNLLKRFLTDILSDFYDNLHIDSVTILNTELSKDRLYIKNKTVDILVDIGSKKINCEVNTKYDSEHVYRNFLYLVQSTVADMKKNMDYSDIDDHIQININFMGKLAQGYEVSEYTNITTGKCKIPFIRTIDVNVDYFKDKWYNLVKSRKYYEKYKSILMFSFDEEDFKSLNDEDEYMKKVKDDIEKLNSDTEFYQWMTDEEDRMIMENTVKNIGRKEGIKEGIEKGSKEKEINIVRNMKKENYSIEEIQKITGLSIEEIEKI